MMTPTTNAINANAAREYAKIAGIAAGAVIVASIPLAAAGALIASALGYDAALVGGSIVSAAIVLAALIGFDALRTARTLIVDQIAAHLSRHTAEAKRIDAEAQRILAEADRIDAESAALTRATSSAAQVNVNSGSGSMKVQNKPIAYTVNGQIVNGNQLNQINQIDQRRIEIPAADVRWFAEQLANGYGHSKSKWVSAKVELPYSRLTVTYEIYKAIIDALAGATPPAIVGRGERASGTLTEKDPAQLVKLIEQTHPGAASKGITLELPAPLP